MMIVKQNANASGLVDIQMTKDELRNLVVAANTLLSEGGIHKEVHSSLFNFYTLALPIVKH